MVAVVSLDSCSTGRPCVIFADDLAGRLTTLSLAPQSSSASRLTAGALFVRGHGRRHRRGVFKKAAFAAKSSVLLIGDAALVSKGCSASAEIASSISTAFNVFCYLGDFLAPALQIVAPAAVAKPSSRKAIRLDPKDVPAYNNRGEALQSQGRSRPCHRRGAAAGAENAFVKSVDLGAVRRRLLPFLFRRRRDGLKPRLDRGVLGVEVARSGTRSLITGRCGSG